MSTPTKKQQIHALLNRGVEQVYPSKAAFEKVLKSKKKLKVYVGFDPTAPHLHIGHAMQLRKLKQFQDLGHEVIWLIGSFTGMIGDPTDKSAARKALTKQQVKKNAATYKKQGSKIVDFSGKNAVKIVYNDKWLSKLGFADILEIAGKFTVGQIIARDMFRKRVKEDKEIFLPEFLYPLMQGYDSVAMDVDVEIGGSDQMFNMMAGRTLMKKMKKKEKYVITLKLLENDEGKKMSKSEGGFIALTDSPEDMFGKIMAMDDSMIVPYFELATDVSMEEVEQKRRALKKKSTNPRDIKMELAFEVVRMYHNAAAAKKAQDNFVQTFQNKGVPTKMPAAKVAGKNIVDALVAAKLVSSKSEARRVIKQGGVKIDGSVVSDDAKVKKGSVIQKGKRHFVKVI